MISYNMILYNIFYAIFYTTTCYSSYHMIICSHYYTIAGRAEGRPWLGAALRALRRGRAGRHHGRVPLGAEAILLLYNVMLCYVMLYSILVILYYIV